MTYCKGFPGAKPLRQQLSQVSSIAEVEEIAARSQTLREENWNGVVPD
jgi:hypothetical protein